jgi:hypothetical protein
MMSSCSSDSLCARLLDAVAHECCVIAEEIAWLGGQVSSGTADITALQSFDFLAQHAQAQALLVAHLARMRDGAQAPGDLVCLVDAIPLPQVRARLLGALNGEAPAPVNDDDAIVWLDA